MEVRLNADATESYTTERKRNKTECKRNETECKRNKTECKRNKTECNAMKRQRDETKETLREHSSTQTQQKRKRKRRWTQMEQEFHLCINWFSLIQIVEICSRPHVCSLG